MVLTNAPLIFIVEDEARIAQLLVKYLSLEGYDYEHMASGEGVVRAVRERNPDLMLLDIMLPGVDGVSLCKDIRTFSDIPIIMTTARVEEIDRLIGFDVGADDYMCKPFSPKELMARIKVHLRRYRSQSEVREDSSLAVADIVLNIECHQVSVKNTPLTLTHNEFSLLRVLMSRPDRVFSRQELLTASQGVNYEGYERNIDTHIKNIRRKVAHVASDRVYIESVYGVGYRFRSDPIPSGSV